MDDGDQWNLMCGNVQVGACNGEGYRSRMGNGWSAPCDPPIPPPSEVFGKCRCQRGHGCKCNGDCHCGKNYGIDRDTGHFAVSERYTVNGRVVTGAEAEAAITGAPALPDDANHPWIVYNAADEAERVKAAKELEPFKDAWRVFTCKASDWYTKGRDGKPVFAPGITCLTPDGRQMRVKDIDALRQVPPDFDPLKVPVGPKPPAPPPGPQPALPSNSTMPWCCIAAAAIVAWNLKKGK